MKKTISSIIQKNKDIIKKREEYKAHELERVQRLINENDATQIRENISYWFSEYDRLQESILKLEDKNRFMEDVAKIVQESKES